MTCRFILLAELALGLAGCRDSGREGASLGICGPISYSAGPKPGVEQGTAALGVDSRSSNVIFAVWVGEGGGGSIRVRNVPARTPGTLLRDHELDALLADVPVSFQTTDEEFGPVKIGSDSFDLAKGTLFLVAKRDARFVVQQMDLAKLDAIPDGKLNAAALTPEYFRQLAERDADIMAFWGGSTNGAGVTVGDQLGSRR